MSERGDLMTEIKEAMQGEGRFAMTGQEYREAVREELEKRNREERIRRQAQLERRIVESNRQDPLALPDMRPGGVNFLPAPQDQPQGHVHPRYAELHARMRAICEAKNSDYADSDTDPLRNFRACERAGIPAFDGCLTRLSDKFERVMNLRRKEREDRTVGVKDESITDTLLDLANYALIAIVLHEELRGE